MSTELAIRGGQENAFELGKVFAESGMFPNVRKAAEAIVKIIAGREFGLGPMAAMNGIHMVDGKPALAANLIAGQVKRHPLYNYKVIRREDDGCELEFFERDVSSGPYASVGTMTWEKKDAEKAKLLGKNNWRSYPRDMYFARCITAGARTFCPDVLGGSPIYTAEELGAEVDGETVIAPIEAEVVEPTAIEPPKWQPSEPQIVELREAYQRTGWWEPNPPRPADHDGDWPPEGYKPPEDWDPHSRLRMALLSVGSGNQGEIPVLLAGLTEDQFTKLREAMTNAQDAHESATVDAIQETFAATEEKA